MSNAKNICTLCNYIYDETTEQTRFEALPDDWHCPECGGDKEYFQPCTCASLPIYEATCVSHQRQATGIPK